MILVDLGSTHNFLDPSVVKRTRISQIFKQMIKVIEEEECITMTGAGVSVRFPAGKFLPPANSLPPKVLLYPSKPGLELLKGWLESDGDG